ncbi:S-formylglutathione hydrolase FrmB [Saccharopolyspora kobensis]|uniref:S-formylglutathione hydrolase FrmB n=1 Tax=Saccharopolyspora kobensis TaxID=146035 RepID=A0A1H6D673_9PSEU|nr:alpha/beta hydrolase-fold protein [Saccharopolyspora kobensis]SEG80283.1 S-formylglutathione hydrolase FrmB [Saccharopolyspora kobensis]SFD11382.1 S-formylglutathione hydrolase FrmB [Saccharopolyspora kobensis]
MRRGRAALAIGLMAASAVVAPSASAAPEPPRLADGFGLTVVSQPEWVDDDHRTFVFAVASDEVPNPTLLPGQTAGQHDIMVTLPADYDSAERYPVLYSLHGNPDLPNTEANQRMAEQATEDQPLITVHPNGVRSWYSNWVNPGPVGPQNWETFHLDQLIPLIDANLSTIPTREGRAIVGHSMGGFGAFHYAEHRPELFSYVGAFSGGLDLLNQGVRAAVIGTSVMEASGTPTVAPDAIFGSPVWPLDGVWNAQSPAQHVESLRGMGVALYTGNGGDLTVNPAQAVVEKIARDTNLVTSANLTAAGIPHTFVDYGDGSEWAEGCTGKHASLPCLQADMNHYVDLIMKRLERP